MYDHDSEGINGEKEAVEGEKRNTCQENRLMEMLCRFSRKKKKSEGRLLPLSILQKKKEKGLKSGFEKKKKNQDSFFRGTSENDIKRR